MTDILQKSDQTVLSWMLLPYRRYFDFKGVSGRSEFGWHCLLVALINALLLIVGMMIFATFFSYPRALTLCIVPVIAISFFQVPSLFAVLVRRFHDANYSATAAVVVLVMFLVCLAFRDFLILILTILALPVLILPSLFLKGKETKYSKERSFVKLRSLIMSAVACIALTLIPSTLDFFSSLRRPAVEGYQDANFGISKSEFERKLSCNSGWEIQSDHKLSCSSFLFLEKEVTTDVQFDYENRFIGITLNLPNDMQNLVLGYLEAKYGRAFGYKRQEQTFYYVYYNRGQPTRMWGGLSNSVELVKKDSKLILRYSSGSNHEF